VTCIQAKQPQNLSKFIKGASNLFGRSFATRSPFETNNEKVRQSFVFSKEVQSSFERGDKPVIALESTIISHGMPWPQNLETALAVENIIRENGATPATICIMKGKVHIGMEEDELKSFAGLKREEVKKCSRRDLAVSIGLGENGATTVSGTMILANLAGIDYFVTGGIGGVHRDAFSGVSGKESTLDVSADLNELGKTPVTVVCAGVKSILHIGHTLEWLETQGVTTVTLRDDNQDSFPSFFTRDSDFRSPNVSNSPEAIARIIAANKSLNLNSGILVAVPNPLPAKPDEIDEAISSALEEASRNTDLDGKDVTPFLLSRVNEYSGGQSLDSNIALIKNNAKVGAQIAVFCHALTREKETARKTPKKKHTIYVCGGSVIDVTAFPVDRMYTSNPGTCVKTLGGVGRNMSLALAKLVHGSVSNRSNDYETSLITAVGADEYGELVFTDCKNEGIDTSHSVRLQTHGTATCVVLLDKLRNLVACVADTAILENIRATQLPKNLNSGDFVILEGNLSESTIGLICEICKREETPVLFEPVSVEKSTRISKFLALVDYVTPNQDELVAMYQSLCSVDRDLGLSQASTPPELEQIEVMSIRVLESMTSDVEAKTSKAVIVTLGDKGVYCVHSYCDGQSFSSFHLAAKQVKQRDVKSVTGAGDTFAGTFVFAHVVEKKSLEDSIRLGIAAAALSIQSEEAVANDISSLC